MTHITKHLDELKQRIRTAAAEAGRNATDVSILAVSKRHNIAAIKAAQAAGLTAMGENYLQEALEKIQAIEPRPEWHFIGRVQSNKTQALAEHFDWVQTVASEKVARRLSRQRPAELSPLNICLQVCVDTTADHGGIAPEQAASLAALVEELPGLRLRGLMTIPLPADNLEEQRIPFRRLHNLYDELRASGLMLDTLSMGMTGDLEAAVLEGSTMVRIGTALFGARPS